MILPSSKKIGGRMKKIAVDARMIESSGIGTVIQNILKRLIVNSKDLFFYVLGDEDILEKYKFLHEVNVEIISCRAPIYSLKEQIIVPKRIPKDTDLLWVPHYNIPVFYSGKMIVTVHDLFHLAMPQFVKGIDKKFYANFMFNAMTRKASHIICVSKFTKNELIKYTGVSSDKISVAYCGVDDFWSLPLQERQRIYQKPYILYVGNIKPHKNLKVLVKAFEKILDEIPHNLVIVGKKEGFITGDKLVFELAQKHAERIQFTGFVSNEELKNYYHYADCLVFPSLYEGFGLPPLEAITAGCKNIICSDIPVLREVYGDYVTYFDPRSDETLIERMREKLTRNDKKYTNTFKKCFSWDFTSNQYLIEVMKNI